jgi:hypothetical protein
MKRLVCFIMFLLFFWLSSSAIADSIVNGSMYYDLATSNKYIKNSEITYAQYSKKGELLKDNVPNTQYHLNNSKYIVELDSSSYLVYEKNIDGKITEQVLPGYWNHPEGWRCKRIVLEE